MDGVQQGGVLEAGPFLGKGISSPAAERAAHLHAALWLLVCNAGGSIQQPHAGLARFLMRTRLNGVKSWLESFGV